MYFGGITNAFSTISSYKYEEAMEMGNNIMLHQLNILSTLFIAWDHAH